MAQNRCDSDTDSKVWMKEEIICLCIFMPWVDYTQGFFVRGAPMKERFANIWALVQENVTFVLISLAIIAGLAIVAKIAQRFLPGMRKVSPARKITITAICAALAAVLHILDFSIPFLAPEFYKLDFSELPVMLCGFYLGPAAAVYCEAVKILLKLLLKGTTTAFVGDFANFCVGCSLVLPAVIIYHTKKNKKTALWGLIAGTLVLTVFGSAFNAFYLLPKFAELYKWPLDEIIALGTKINPRINSITTFVLFAVAPLNLIKGVSVSALTLLLYKKVARPLFGK